MVEMWKKTSTVRVKNLVDLRDLLQASTNWDPSYILERKLIHTSGPWTTEGNPKLDEILMTGNITTKVTEEDMIGVLSLLHKGGPLADQPSH